jgi:hypothetical protein
MALGVIGSGLEFNSIVYEVDFTSLPTQDLSSGGNGAKTIDGRTWYAWNTGTNNIRVTNGVGIEIDGASVNAAYRTLVMSLAGISGVDPVNDDLELWVDVSFNTTPVSYQIFGAALDRVWTSTPTRYPRPLCAWENASGFRYSIYNLNGSNIFTSTDAFANSNDRVFVTRGKRNIANLSAAVTADFSFWVGASLGGTVWPAFSALKHTYTLAAQTLDYTGAMGPTLFSFDDPTTQRLIVKKMRVLKQSQTL